MTPGHRANPSPGEEPCCSLGIPDQRLHRSAQVLRLRRGRRGEGVRANPRYDDPPLTICPQMASVTKLARAMAVDLCFSALPPQVDGALPPLALSPFISFKAGRNGVR